MKVLVLTTVHSRSDSRIFAREAPTVGSLRSVEVKVIVADGLGPESRTGYDVVDLGKPHAGRLGRFTGIYFKALRVVLHEKPDVLHVHDPELLPLAYLAQKINRGSFVYDAHEDFPKDILDKHWIPSSLRKAVALVAGAVEAGIASKANHVVAATEHVARRFPAHRTTVIRNFPLLEEFDFVDTVRTSGDPRDFLYLGSITEVRGVNQLVKAMPFVLHRDARLVLAGGVTPESFLGKMRAEAGWTRTTYMGHVHRDGLESLFQGVAAGLLTAFPKNNALESVPTKFFEYMAAGVPLIVSDFPAWRALLEDVGCALFVDPENPRDIANAMNAILADPRRSALMGARGRRAVLSQLNWEREGSRLADLYQSLH